MSWPEHRKVVATADRSPAVWAGAGSPAGLEKMRRVDQVASKGSFLMPQAHVVTCPSGCPPLGPSVVLSLCYLVPSIP